ncbi:MAG: DUF5658 family protein [Paludibacteraceae bacterium]|nr:DUF5658 family protein [Paludibacteraceae bacterium]
MIKVIISLVIIYILNIIDYFQTIYAVSLAGIGVEANPIGRIMLESGYGWIVKLIVVPIVLIILGATINTARKQSWVVYLLLVFDFVVIINNFIVLSKLGGI